MSEAGSQQEITPDQETGGTVHSPDSLPAQVSSEVGFPGELTDVMLRERVKAAELHVEYLERIKALALQSTRPDDWVKMGKEPYLMAKGSEAIARTFGLTIEKLGMGYGPPIKDTDEYGEYIVIPYSGRVSKGSDFMDVEGQASSHADLYKRRHDDDSVYYAHASMSDLRQKAYTNFLNNAIKRFLGLRGLTWEDLEKAGIKTGDQAVEYKGKSGGNGAGQSGQKKEVDPKVDAEIRGKLFGLICDICKIDITKTLDDASIQYLSMELEKMTAFEGKEDDGTLKIIKQGSLNKLKGAWLAKTYGNAKIKAERLEKGQDEVKVDDEMFPVGVKYLQDQAAASEPAEEQPPADNDIPF